MERANSATNKPRPFSSDHLMRRRESALAAETQTSGGGGGGIARARSFSLATSKNRCKRMDNEKALRFELECRRTGKCREIVADVQHSRMPRHMEQEACSLAAKSIMTYHLEHDIARHLKLAFDREYGPDWHCICGKHFGSFVTFEPDSFIYFRIGTIAFMLFKTSLQRLPIMEKQLENVKLTPKTMLGRRRLETKNEEEEEEEETTSDSGTSS